MTEHTSPAEKDAQDFFEEECIEVNEEDIVEVTDEEVTVKNEIEDDVFVCIEESVRAENNEGHGGAYEDFEGDNDDFYTEKTKKMHLRTPLFPPKKKIELESESS